MYDEPSLVIEDFAEASEYDEGEQGAEDDTEGTPSVCVWGPK